MKTLQELKQELHEIKEELINLFKSTPNAELNSEQVIKELRELKQQVLDLQKQYENKTTTTKSKT